MSITHVSDTARWVAVYRDMESKRPDALFRDPYALRLAGVEGEQIVDSMKKGRQMAWPMIVRTALIDEVLMRAIEEDGIDTVMNLGAGLDARPWRLDLPADLRWFDVDLPGILDHKLEVLADETPRCAYDARKVDLTDIEARRELFSDIGAGGRRVLAISEGLLIYLHPEQVASLAADVSAAGVTVWLIDLGSPLLLKFMNRSWGKAVEEGNAPFRFAPAEGTAFFEPHGWREGSFLSMGEEAQRLGRTMRGAWLWRAVGFFMSKTRREKYQRMSGVVRLDRIEP